MTAIDTLAVKSVLRGTFYGYAATPDQIAAVLHVIGHDDQALGLLRAMGEATAAKEAHEAIPTRKMTAEEIAADPFAAAFGNTVPVDQDAAAAAFHALGEANAALAARLAAARDLADTL